jgi:hypothetical protein
MAAAPSHLDRLLAADYLGDLAGLSLADLRSRRAECQRVEVSLSYVRRLVQGRLDIVHAEVERRTGGSSGDLAGLIENLPEILSGHVSGEGPGRLPVFMTPDVEESAELGAELEAVAGADTLGRLTTMGDGEVSALADSLSELESRVSAQRRALHERIDVLQAELVHRYKSGEASVDHLLS